MRAIILTVLISPIIRTSLAITTASSRVPAPPQLSYPVCRRNSICASPSRRDHQSIMNGLETQEVGNKERLAEAAEPCEGEILGMNTAREQALKDKAALDEGATKEETLPKLSAAEFRAYNSMAEHMEYFHNHFRQTWTVLYNACLANKRPANLTLKQFISTGLQFVLHLSTHHAIEEQHIFPLLAAKMPEFKAGRNAAELLRQHREIHAGLDVFEEYLQKCSSGETELELRVLKEKMDSWGEVLWTHLDQEVKTLGAENMRKYWTIEEMRRMPM